MRFCTERVKRNQQSQSSGCAGGEHRSLRTQANSSLHSGCALKHETPEQPNAAVLEHSSGEMSSSRKPGFGHNFGMMSVLAESRGPQTSCCGERDQDTSIQTPPHDSDPHYLPTLFSL